MVVSYTAIANGMLMALKSISLCLTFLYLSCPTPKFWHLSSNMLLTLSYLVNGNCTLYANTKKSLGVIFHYFLPLTPSYNLSVNPISFSFRIWPTFIIFSAITGALLASFLSTVLQWCPNWTLCFCSYPK